MKARNKFDTDSKNYYSARFSQNTLRNSTTNIDTNSRTQSTRDINLRASYNGSNINLNPINDLISAPPS